MDIDAIKQSVGSDLACILLARSHLQHTTERGEQSWHDYERFTVFALGFHLMMKAGRLEKGGDLGAYVSQARHLLNDYDKWVGRE